MNGWIHLQEEFNCFIIHICSLCWSPFSWLLPLLLLKPMLWSLNKPKNTTLRPANTASGWCHIWSMLFIYVEWETVWNWQLTTVLALVSLQLGSRQWYQGGRERRAESHRRWGRYRFQGILHLPRWWRHLHSQMGCWWERIPSQGRSFANSPTSARTRCQVAPRLGPLI